MIVIVIVIIGAISAIAIPRMTRGAQDVGGTALKGNLKVLRNAIEMCRAEHEGRFPDNSDMLADQLTKFTKIAGTDADDSVDTTSGRIYGPYISVIPPLTVGPKAGAVGVQASPPAGPDIGWIYSGGAIRATTKSTLLDKDGVPYRDY